MSGAAKNIWHAFDAGILRDSLFVLYEPPTRADRFWHSEYGIAKLLNHPNPSLCGWPFSFSITDAFFLAPILKLRVDEVTSLYAIGGSKITANSAE